MRARSRSGLPPLPISVVAQSPVGILHAALDKTKHLSRTRLPGHQDAVHATRAAVAEGIGPGGGVALLRARAALAGVHGPTIGQQAGIKIVRRALEEPLRQIVANAGLEPSVVLQRVVAGEGNFGYNAATGDYGDMVAMGIIDPTKVTRLGLQNAASIASLVLTTDCVIVNAPKHEAPQAEASMA